MALVDKSLLLYNYEITPQNRSIDFRAVSLGPIIQASCNLGFYSLTSLLQEIVRAMQEADPANTYIATADRTVMGGLENRVSLSTTGAYLDLLFLSGPRTATTIAPLIGFAIVDQTGATLYTGTSTSGVILTTAWWGFNYLGPDFNQKVFGSVNISTSGKKEAIVFSIQKFIQVEYKYEPQAKVTTDWLPFWSWAIQQRNFDFTPEIASPTVYYNVTLEATGGDGQGLGFMMTEQLPQFPFQFTTGKLKFRVSN